MRQIANVTCMCTLPYIILRVGKEEVNSIILQQYCYELIFRQISHRPWDSRENFGIYYQLDRKSKTWFFTFLSMYVFWIERGKILILQLSPPKFRYFADQNGPKGGPHENEFWQFSNVRMSSINRVQKADEKNGVICLVFMSPPKVMVLKLSKIVSFCKFLLMSESKALIAIDVYGS